MTKSDEQRNLAEYEATVTEERLMEQSSLAETQAEAMYVTHEYGPLMELYDAVEASNRAFQEQCREVMRELDEENAGDM